MGKDMQFLPAGESSSLSAWPAWPVSPAAIPEELVPAPECGADCEERRICVCVRESVFLLWQIESVLCVLNWAGLFCDPTKLL